MTEKEQKAIKILKETDLYNLGHDDRFEELRLYENALETVLNLISNLQKENEELHKELDLKDKVIDNLYSDIEYEYQGTHYLKSLEEYYEEVEKVGGEDE